MYNLLCIVYAAQSTAGKAAESGDYSKWETACRKVDMGLRKNNVATSQLPTEKKETPLMGYKKGTSRCLLDEVSYAIYEYLSW